MPVPVIPICAISCCIPKPICEYKEPICQPIYQPIQKQCLNVSQPVIDSHIRSEIDSSPLQIPNYYPGISEQTTGSILTISSTTIPYGYLSADGAEISRSTYGLLFSIIGSNYGDGDGINTFNLPNLSSDVSDFEILYIIKI